MLAEDEIVGLVLVDGALREVLEGLLVVVLVEGVDVC